MVNRIAVVLLTALVCAWVVLSPAAAQQKGDATKKDTDLIQGTWTFTSMVQDGNEMKGDASHTITFAGDKFSVKVADMVVQAGTQKFDATKKPKTVDATVSEGEGKGTTM